VALASTFTVKAVCELSSALDLASASVPLTLAEQIQLTSGTGANQADLIFHDRRTLAASATEDLDLAGALTNALGATLTFARIKAVIVSAADANTNNVNVTRPAANGVLLFLAAADGIAVRPGGVFAWIAPDATAVPVTAGTGDLLTLTNSSSGTAVTYDVVIVGASA
jgi:hypothetical protein